MTTEQKTRVQETEEQLTQSMLQLQEMADEVDSSKETMRIYKAIAEVSYAIEELQKLTA